MQKLTSFFFDLLKTQCKISLSKRKVFLSLAVSILSSKCSNVFAENGKKRITPLSSSSNTKPVDVSVYYNGDWFSAFNLAFEASDLVIVPKNLVCDNFNKLVTVPQQKKLIIKGRIAGKGNGGFLLNSESFIQGDGGTLYNVYFLITNGKHNLTGLNMSGTANIAQFLILGDANSAINNLVIDNFYIKDSNYGILRQGSKSAITNANITNGRFENLQGDAIEWNVAIHDSNINISDHDINGINCTNGKINWGIGIGFAGSYYDNTFPDKRAVKNFVIKNIKGKNCRQLIHVENGKNFVISDITAENISPIFSKNAGIDNAAIAIYGSDNFKINNVKIKDGSGIFIGFGIIKNKYISVSQNFIIQNISLTNDTHYIYGMKINCGNSNSFVQLKYIAISGASLEILGKPQKLSLEHINIVQNDLDKKALILDTKFHLFSMNQFDAKGTRTVDFIDVTAVNKNKETSFILESIGDAKVTIQNSNISSERN